MCVKLRLLYLLVYHFFNFFHGSPLGWDFHELSNDGLGKLKISQNDKLEQVAVINHITPKFIGSRVKT